MLTHVNILVTVQYMYMHIQGTMCLKKIFTDACSHISVHTMFTYASGSVVHENVDKHQLYAHTGYNVFKETIHRCMFTQ